MFNPDSLCPVWMVALLHAESLIRECHPIHDKLVELADFIKAKHCQDFVPLLYPVARQE